MSNSENDHILDLAIAKGALLFGEFKLSAGGTSSYYFDGRILSLDPEGGYAVAKALLPIIEESGARAIAGPTLGADPIVSAVSVVSHLESLQRGGGKHGGSAPPPPDKHPIPGLIVRKETKGYGGQRAIEGPTAGLGEGAPVAVVDDTCTTGSSLFHAIDAVEAAGYEVVKVLSILDRNEGGSAELRRRGYSYHALLSADSDGRITPQ